MRSQHGDDFLAILVNPPWDGIKPGQLAGMQLEKHCPLGFIFVWVEKEVLSDVVDVFAAASFVYVENLTWVLMAPNNKVRRLCPSDTGHVLSDASRAGSGGKDRFHRPLAPYATHLPQRCPPVPEGQGD